LRFLYIFVLGVIAHCYRYCFYFLLTFIDGKQLCFLYMFVLGVIAPLMLVLYFALDSLFAVVREIFAVVREKLLVLLMQVVFHLVFVLIDEWMSFAVVLFFAFASSLSSIKHDALKVCSATLMYASGTIESPVVGSILCA